MEAGELMEEELSQARTLLKSTDLLGSKELGQSWAS
jgi:hypothetical protein